MEAAQVIARRETRFPSQRNAQLTDSLTINLELILLVVCLVAIATRWLRFPYSAGLVAAGCLLALLPRGIEIPLPPDKLFGILLPPLIFEAALQIRWTPFRREAPVILTLAFAGVVMAAMLVATGMHVFTGWGWVGAIAFGFLIAATDPVSVIALFKELNVPPRLRFLVEGESLFNDGVAAVGLAVTVAIAGGSELHSTTVAGLLIWKLLGGVLIGGGIAGALLLLSGRTEDHLVELTLTTMAAYGSFLVAERLETSGVLASLSAGMVVGNLGWRGYISQTGRGYVESFWEYAAFLANSIVFIVIGLSEAHEAIGLFTRTAATAIALVLLSRVATVYLLCKIFEGSHLAVERRYQHVLVWGGLRGALALALALTLPGSVRERDEIILAAFAVVAFSIFVQGLTMAPLIRRLGCEDRTVEKQEA